MTVMRHALLLLCLFGFATPAAAGLRMSSGQKIDFVRDLPNESPFEYDGQYYDLGYLYSERSSRGGGFVLYHDDQYVQLDSAGLSDVRMALGEDPTEGYVPPSGGTPRTFSDTGSSESPYPGGTPVAPRARSSGAGGAFATIGVLFLIFVGGAARFFMRSAFGFGYGGWRRRPVIEADYADPFASRVSARMAELDNERARTGGYDAPQSGGFGKRGI